MKKITIIITLLFLFVLNTNALGTINVEPSFNCIIEDDSNNYYRAREIFIDNELYYFLNHKDIFAYDYEASNYYEIDYHNLDNYEKILEYASLSNINISIDAAENYCIIYGYIWNQIYNDINHVHYEETNNYNNIMKRIDILLNGTNFSDKILVQEVYQNESYYYPYLNLFEIVDDDGLFVDIDEASDILNVQSNSVGTFVIKLKRKDTYESLPKLYTNGSDYLLKPGKVPEKIFTITIEIVAGESILYTYDSENNPVEGSCFDIYENATFIENVCTNEEGIATFSLPPATYIFKNTNYNEKYINEYEEFSYGINGSTYVEYMYTLKEKQDIPFQNINNNYYLNKYTFNKAPNDNRVYNTYNQNLEKLDSNKPNIINNYYQKAEEIIPKEKENKCKTYNYYYQNSNEKKYENYYYLLILLAYLINSILIIINLKSVKKCK